MVTPTRLWTSVHEDGGERVYGVNTECFPADDGNVRGLRAHEVKLAGGPFQKIEGTDFEIRCELVLPKVDVLHALEVGIGVRRRCSPGEIHVPGGPWAGATVGEAEIECQAALEDPRIGEIVSRRASTRWKTTFLRSRIGASRVARAR
jgi:hypothetical protein